MPRPTSKRPSSGVPRYGHQLRDALMQLIDRDGSTTSTAAARELGESSGACSFHLRRLAAAGLVEEVPGPGRAKPWRRPAAADALDELNRELEDVAFEAWRRATAGDAEALASAAAFSEIVRISPTRLREFGRRFRELVDEMAATPARRGAVDTAVIVRLFPVPRADDDRPAGDR